MRLLSSLRRTTIALVLSCTGVAALATPAAALPDWRTTESRWDNARAFRPVVADLRYARHGSFDRVVVDLRGRRAGFATFFTDRLSYDPSGQPVPLRGRYATYLTLTPAVTYGYEGENLYDGPRLRRPEFPALRGLALVGSWEGQTTFGFTSRTRPYRIFTLTDPSRVVIDFRH